jgi:Uma2 family endonuclease
MTLASTMVPLDEYLHTSYEHDCEWVNGELKERGMPDGYHAYFQSFFLVLFARLSSETGLRALPEVRIRVNPLSYRIPDVLVVPSDVAFLPAPAVTPLLCIEVLSPDDRVSDLQEKIVDYVAMGVGAIWIVDPRRRTMSTADASGMHIVREFRLAGTTVKITAAELFDDLDRYEKLGA